MLTSRGSWNDGTVVGAGVGNRGKGGSCSRLIERRVRAEALWKGAL